MKRFFTLLLLFFATSAGAQVQQPQLPDGASASWWAEVQKNIRESEYHIRPKGDGEFSSPNRAQNLRFTYSDNRRGRKACAENAMRSAVFLCALCG